MKRAMLASSTLALITAVSTLPQVANAHGYTSYPPSRAQVCRLGQNQDCGAAMYEPHSVGEAPLPLGYPASGPADGKLASGGVRADFAPLDEQSANRWHKTLIEKREIEFDWYYTIGHATAGWDYYITRQGWNPNEPLSRAAFDSTPFCKVDHYGSYPREDLNPGPGAKKHACTLPDDRDGHHVIMGIWKVQSPVNGFFSVMDVNIDIDGSAQPEWRQISDITPHRDLEVGDKVKARAFVGATESAEYSVQIPISNAEEGLAANWSYTLAQRINETQTLIQAGQRDAEGVVRPVRGANLIFAKAESGVTSYELDIDGKPGDNAYLHVHDLKAEYSLKDGKGSVDFSAMSNRKLQVTSRLYDAANQQVGYVRQQMEAGTAPVALEATSTAGKHLLKVVGVDKTGRVMLQQEHDVQLVEAGSSDYDFVFPQSIETYKAGTRVLQSKTEEVFECKPFPAEGWCRNYSESANHYEPGVGSHWQDAWIKH